MQRSFSSVPNYSLTIVLLSNWTVLDRLFCIVWSTSSFGRVEIMTTQTQNPANFSHVTASYNAMLQFTIAKNCKDLQIFHMSQLVTIARNWKPENRVRGIMLMSGSFDSLPFSTWPISLLRKHFIKIWTSLKNTLFEKVGIMLSTGSLILDPLPLSTYFGKYLWPLNCSWKYHILVRTFWECWSNTLHLFKIFSISMIQRQTRETHIKFVYIEVFPSAAVNWDHFS